jgi:hypothetical protein
LVLYHHGISDAPIVGFSPRAQALTLYLTVVSQAVTAIDTVNYQGQVIPNTGANASDRT